MDQQLERYLTASPYFAGFDQEEAFSRDSFLALYEKLPPATQEFLIASETADKVWDIGSAYRLGPEQIAILGRAVREVAVGNIALRNLAPVLAQKMRLDQATVQALTTDIGSRVIRSAPEAPRPAPTAPMPGQPINKHNIIDLKNRNS